VGRLVWWFCPKRRVATLGSDLFHFRVSSLERRRPDIPILKQAKADYARLQYWIGDSQKPPKAPIVLAFRYVPSRLVVG
jgi:hypothetical protein